MAPTDKFKKSTKIDYYAPTDKERLTQSEQIAKSAGVNQVTKFSKVKNEDNPWDVVLLRNKSEDFDVVLPGIATVNVNVKFNYSQGRFIGYSRPTIKYNGRDPSEIEVSLQISSKEEFDSWTGVCQELIKISSKALNAEKYDKRGVDTNVMSKINTIVYDANSFEITHPQCVVYGIKRCILTNISSPQPNARDGWNIKLTFIEYVTPERPELKSDGSARNNLLPDGEPGK